MLQFLDLFGFLSVILRASALSLSAVVVGGVIFRFFVARGPLASGAQRVLIFSGFALAIVQLFYVLANSEILSASAGLPLVVVAGASYFIWGCSSAIAACTIGILAAKTGSRIGLLGILCAGIILSAEVATSHAAARLDEQTILIVATAAHQASAAAWIGGLPYLLLTLRSCDDVSQAASVCRRFSRLAVVSVSLLFAAGLVLSKLYIGDASGLYGTTYGIMVAAKVLLFGLILLLGSLNFRLIRNRSGSDIRWLKQLRRISEAEIGIGITVILAAASLTSQPPAIDLTKNRVSLSTIAQRMAPQVPRMSTPPLSTLSPSTRELWKRQHSSNVDTIQTYIPGQEPSVPPTEGDIAWSEYNHHWAGLIVLVMGVLAAFARYRRFAYAKHWPLAFIGLAVFLLVRADPENWPLGPNGFWESFTSADVAQHRLFVLLIVLFAVFEWGVQTRRLTSRRAALVFPAICCAGGALLLTHTHAVTNIVEELLAELTHLPLALLAVLAGWARWLEIRVPMASRIPAKITACTWPISFVLIGVVLLLYREA